MIFLSVLIMGLTGCAATVDTMQVTPELYLNMPTTTGAVQTETVTVEDDTEIDVLKELLPEIVIVEDDIERATKRLAQFHKRLNSSNIDMRVQQITAEDTNITECTIEANYYADCANVHYKDNKLDVGLVVMGKDSYLLDNTSKVAYSVATCDIKYATSASLVSMFSTQDGAYMGTSHQKVTDDVTLSCDVYYVDNVLYKMCYAPETDALIMTIRLDGKSECCNIFEVLTTVEDMSIFEVPSDYIYLQFDDYLKVRNGENDKFALFII